VAATLQTDELSDVFQVLTEDILIAIGQDRHGASAEFGQPLLGGRIVQYIERGEADSFSRKKLFRSEAAASAGLGVENKLVSGFFHGPTT
jgi:hypothetical protein